MAPRVLAEGRAKGSEGEEHLDVEHPGAAPGAPNQVHGQAFRQSRPVHRQAQSEDAQQEVGHGLGKAVESGSQVGHRPRQHQQHHPHHAHHGNGQSLGGPQRHRQAHYRQRPLSFWRQAFRRGGQQYQGEDQ